MEKKNIENTTGLQNQFSAYLLSFVKGKRRDYLVKKIDISKSEKTSEESLEIHGNMKVEFEEQLEQHQKREQLLKETRGNYPEWDKMSNQTLSEALSELREEERRLIYQHVFEERSFAEMSKINGLSDDRVKGIYYYAIRKIRKMMGGEK